MNEFGVLGMQNESLLLYDTKTRSHWSQLGGDALAGQLEGQALDRIPSVVTTWGEWKTLHPETTVYVRRLFPYRSRFTANDLQVSRGEGISNQAGRMVIAVESEGEVKAYPMNLVGTPGTLHNEMIKDQPILISMNERGDTIRVLSRVVEGRVLTFSLTEQGIVVDRESQSVWDLTRLSAIAGPLKGMRLDSFPFTCSRWSAWQQYRPNTLLVDEVSN